MPTGSAQLLPLDRDVALLQDLIRCRPVYGSEGLYRAQELLHDYLDGELDTFYAKEIKQLHGYVDVTAFGPLYHHYEEVPKRNLIKIVDSDKPGPTLLLNGHIDVDLIPETPEWDYPDGEIIQGRLFGRGSTDMLGGLLSLALITKQMERLDGWCGKVIFMAVTDEEIGGNGTLRALDLLKGRDLLSDAECLIAEPSNGYCCLSSLGFAHMKKQFCRPSLHMGMATKSNNAIWDLNSFLNGLEEQLPNDIICNIGILSGGEDAAIPLSEISIEGTLFFPEHYPREELAERLGVTLSDFGFEGAAFHNSNLHKLLSASIPSNTFPSPCDARLFKPYGIPTVIYGPGSLKQAHALNESLCLDEWRHYTEHLATTIYDYMQ